MVAIFSREPYNSLTVETRAHRNPDPRQLDPGTRSGRCRCSLPGLTEFTADRRGGTDADECTLTASRTNRTVEFPWTGGRALAGVSHWNCARGEMAERSKALAWKASVRFTPYRGFDKSQQRFGRWSKATPPAGRAPQAARVNPTRIDLPRLWTRENRAFPLPTVPNGSGTTRIAIAERWPSGRRRLLGKQVYGSHRTVGSNPTLSAIQSWVHSGHTVTSSAKSSSPRQSISIDFGARVFPRKQIQESTLGLLRKAILKADSE